MKNIVIIGAGIGGLTTAIALKQKGFQVSIYEQASEIKPVGAGILLANNAMQVYEKLGLRQEIEEAGNIISSLNITKKDLSPISKMSMTGFEEKYGVRNVAIHRGLLQQFLASRLADHECYLNKKLTAITEKDGRYILDFTDGSSTTAELVIGADGIHSSVRHLWFGNGTIRNAQQLCWRGMTEYALPFSFQHELNEAWGKGDRFGIVPISRHKVYWFAVKKYKGKEPRWDTHDIGSHFSTYHPLIGKLISLTPADSIHVTGISDLRPLASWVREGVCLLGDAAHATTPNMGQGACQAIEDAYVLAESLDQYPTHPEALAHYQRLRIAKAHDIVAKSRILGKIAHLQNPILTAIRNFLLKATPPSVSIKQSDKIFQLAECKKKGA